MKTCSLCESTRFCAVPARLPGGGSVRCTRDPGHKGEHAACGETAREHPIFRWPPGPAKNRRHYRSRTTRTRAASAKAEPGTDDESPAEPASRRHALRR